MDRPDVFVTPEAVELVVDSAGLGSRMIALLIDSLIQVAAALVLTLVFGELGRGSGPVQVVYFVALFMLAWAYFPLFESLWGGRTPGKRAQRLRVVRSDGQPAGAGPIVVRNIVRLADFLPSFYAAGVTSILLSRRHQRLGDLAAGTMVVREHAPPEPAPIGLPLRVDQTLDTAGLSQRDYVIVRDFLDRRRTLDPAARGRIAHELASALRGRVGGQGPAGAEAFLEAVAGSFRERFSGEGT